MFYLFNPTTAITTDATFSLYKAFVQFVHVQTRLKVVH